MSPEPSGLVCPACRRAVDGVLHVQRLRSDGPFLACACGARHPVLDGIPLVFRDLDRWLASEGAEALRRRDLPEALEERLVRGSGGSLARNDALVAAYARSREGALQAWLRHEGGRLEGRILELGCGVGVTGRPDVIGVDHNLALLRHHAGIRICADACDPPFLGGSFDAVVLANVLDSTADPGLLLAQAVALLRPGGALVVSCAYAFQESVLERRRWFEPDALEAALDGRAALGGYRFELRCERREADLEWPIEGGPRLRHLYRADAFVCRKWP